MAHTQQLLALLPAADVVVLTCTMVRTRPAPAPFRRPVERHATPTGRERTGSRTLQALQDPTLRTPWSAFEVAESHHRLPPW
jgi:hypothetical protein